MQQSWYIGQGGAGQGIPGREVCQTQKKVNLVLTKNIRMLPAPEPPDLSPSLFGLSPAILLEKTRPVHKCKTRLKQAIMG